VTFDFVEGFHSAGRWKNVLQLARGNDGLPCSITVVVVPRVIFRISRLVLLPELLVLVHALGGKLLGPGNGRQRAAGLLKHLELISCELAGLVDAVHADPVSRRRDVQAPVPGRADGQRLCVERVVPAAADDLDPALDVARQVYAPRAPGPFALLGQVLQRHFVPAEAAVGREFDALGPPSTAAVGPAFAVDGAIVDDHLVLPW
jgi:hypothetical protein